MKFINIEIRTNTKNVTKDVKNLNKEVDQTQDSVEQMGGVLDDVTGGAVTKFKKMTSAIKGVALGFKSVGAAIAMSGIGLLVVAVGALTAAFQGSEEGQNKFAKIMSVIGAVTGNLIDLLADLGEKLIWVFENPREALENFGKMIRENISNRIEGMLDLIPALGRAIKLALSGEFSEAAKVAVDAVGKASLGVESLTESINGAIDATKEFAAEQIKEGKEAAKVADMRAKAAKLERDLLIERSLKESQIAELRLKARQEQEFSAEERRAALLDAQKLENELLDKETTVLELRRDAQILENTFSRTNIENLNKEAQARADVNNQIAQRANTARQLQRELNTIDGQVRTENARILAEEKAKEKELYDYKISLREALAVEQADRDALEIIKIQEKYQAIIDQAIKFGEDIKVIEDARDAAIEAKEADQKVKRDALAAKELADAKKNADDKVKLEENVATAKVNIVSSGLGLIQKIAGEDSKIGKAIAIGQTTLSTIQGVQAAFTSASASPITAVFPAYPFIQAGTAGAFGAAQLAALRSTNVSSGGGGSASVSAPPSIGATASIAISDSGLGNQLENALGKQGSKPVRSYVLSSDVTSNQSFDRKVVSTATLGG
jgi:hypothetical protein